MKTTGIFIAGEGNYYWSERGLEEREVFMVTLFFSERGISVLSVKFMFGLGLYYIRGRSCRVQYPTGIQVRYLSLDYCLIALWKESSCSNFFCGWYPGSGLLRP